MSGVNKLDHSSGVMPVMINSRSFGERLGKAC